MIFPSTRKGEGVLQLPLPEMYERCETSQQEDPYFQGSLLSATAVVEGIIRGSVRRATYTDVFRTHYQDDIFIFSGLDANVLTIRAENYDNESFDISEHRITDFGRNGAKSVEIPDSWSYKTITITGTAGATPPLILDGIAMAYRYLKGEAKKESVRDLLSSYLLT